MAERHERTKKEECECVGTARSRKRIVKKTAPMNTGKIVRDAMKKRGYTQAMLAQRLGYSGQNAISMALSGRNMRVDILCAMLDELGFEVVVRDRNKANRENVWVIEPEKAESGEG